MYVLLTLFPIRFKPDKKEYDDEHMMQEIIQDR